MTRLDIDPEEGEAFELVAWCKSLKQKVRLVIHYLPEVDTDCISRPIPLSAAKMSMTFTGHGFRLSSVFRDGHQFTGLLDCQARDEKALDFAYNASFAAVNITKVLRKQTNMPFYWSN